MGFCKFCGANAVAVNQGCFCGEEDREPCDPMFCEHCGRELSGEDMIQGSEEKTTYHHRIRGDGHSDLYDSIDDVPEGFKDEVNSFTCVTAVYGCPECGKEMEHDYYPDDDDDY